jgi:hypothetical protein
MKRKIRNGVAAFAALGALALGGSAIAGAVSHAPKSTAVAPVSKQSNQSRQATAKAPENASATDTDSVQSGDQSAPDTTGSEAPGTETPDSAPETGSEQSGSEVPGNDGPGGHADEPGSPNADHQAQGQE